MSSRLAHAALVIAIITTVIACGGKGASPKSPAAANIDGGAAKVTFLELGSTTCIPCRQMQPVMKSIETRYAGQVRVIFHDVMKDRTQSQKYRIKLIPTQVFLDQSGKEIMRHEGFFAEEEIDKFLKMQGLTPQS